jgi:hypothetical protein
MTIEMEHVKTGRRVSKLVGQVESEREAIAEALKNGTDGTRGLLLCELANLLHEAGQALHALRPGR